MRKQSATYLLRNLYVKSIKKYFDLAIPSTVARHQQRNNFNFSIPYRNTLNEIIWYGDDSNNS